MRLPRRFSLLSVVAVLASWPLTGAAQFVPLETTVADETNTFQPLADPLEIELPSLGQQTEIAMELLESVTPATNLVATTGDLGITVRDGFDPIEVNVSLPSIGATNYTTVTIRYGLWNSPDVTVTASLNGQTIGTFVANSGYSSPGPSFVTFDITGLTLAGANTFRFVGDSSGDYVVTQLEIRAVPEPSTLALLALGLGLAGWTARRRFAR